MESTKQFTVNFYRGHVGADDADGEKFASQLSLLKKSKERLNQNKKIGLKIAESNTKFLFGELKIYRDEAPHLGKPSGLEREIDMDKDEHVIEKAYFLYAKEYNTLMLQITDHFRSPKAISDVMNAMNPPKTIYCSNILNLDSVGRLSNNKQEITRIECAVTLPTGRAMSPSDDWRRSAITLADGATGRLAFNISGNMRGNSKEPLEPSTVQKVIEGVKSGFLSKAKAYPMDGEPIDLLKDRLTDKIYPTMAGKYPIPRSVKDELMRAFSNNTGILDEYKPR